MIKYCKGKLTETLNDITAYLLYICFSFIRPGSNVELHMRRTELQFGATQIRLSLGPLGQTSNLIPLNGTRTIQRKKNFFGSAGKH